MSSLDPTPQVWWFCLADVVGRGACTGLEVNPICPPFPNFHSRPA